MYAEFDKEMSEENLKNISEKLAYFCLRPIYTVP
jgi:hypothetical protein